jgi:hypothetical protein
VNIDLKVCRQQPNTLYIHAFNLPSFYNKFPRPRLPSGPPQCGYWLLKPEVVEWLSEFDGLLHAEKIFRPEVHHWDLYGQYDLRFTSHEAMVMFKLRWQGQ